MKDCGPLIDYKFYLSFENSACSEYITEKLWWNGYNKFSIPIVLGGKSRDDYAKLAPPNSFIHVDDFRDLKDLANFINFLDKNEENYLKFHEWRRQFRVLNEHGFFGADTRHYCRLCQALNYNEEISKTYDNMGETFWSVQKDCKVKK